jgi:hydroxypyruvate isomerase
MPRFAANLSMLFTEVPFAQRFGRAKLAGFDVVECQFPYELPAVEVKALLDANGQTMVLHNLPAGDWAAGDRGIACDPARVQEFRDGVTRAITYATLLGVKKINCLAGKAPAGVPEAQVRQTVVDNLRFAVAELEKHGIALLVEPINNYDIPGFCLNSTAKALEVLDEVGAENAFVQYDIYHAQRMEGELAGHLQQHLSRIGHIQIADNPGRNEPGTGEINFAFLFEFIDRIGYTGYIGAEYKPAGQTEAGLGWIRALAR